MREFLTAARRMLRTYGPRFAIMLLGIVLVCGTVCAGYLFLPPLFARDGVPETVEYTLFGKKSTVEGKRLFRDGVLYLNLTEIAAGCGLGVSGNRESLTYATQDGAETLTVTDGSDLCSVNGVPARMGHPAVIDGTDGWVPMEFLARYATGLDILCGEGVLTVSRTPGTDAVGFALKREKTLQKISDSGIGVDVRIDEEELNYEFLNDFSACKKYLDPADRDRYLLLYSPARPSAGTGEPESLTVIADLRKNSRFTYSLETAAEKSLEAMLQEMRTAGISGVYALRGYVSYADQKKNFDSYVWNERYYYRDNYEKTGKYFSDAAYEVLGKSYLGTVYVAEGKFVLSQQDASAVAASYCAVPGTSDHQTGLGVDLSDKAESYAGFADSAAYAWLRENAYRFGFVERYPEGTEKMTDFPYEPCHWRFVGQYHAAIMHRDGYCLEEYLAVLGMF